MLLGGGSVYGAPLHVNLRMVEGACTNVPLSHKED